MKNSLICSTAVVILIGCAHTGGVMKMGPDTYRVTSMAAPLRGGSAGAQNLALEEANKYCTSINKEIFVTNVGHRDLNGAGAGSSDVTFRCLDKGDRDLYRPTYQSSPNVIIQDERR
jgi:hypothetical protein